MKDTSANRLFRRSRNTAVFVFALTLLNGPLIQPAIVAIDLLAILVIGVCLGAMLAAWQLSS